MTSYDAWKLMSPEDERERTHTYDCDCCGRSMPSRYFKQAWTTCGVEAWACAECRNGEPPEPDDLDNYPDEEVAP